MDLIRLAIERPIAVIAAVLMVVMFGLVALQTIPIQLAPDVNRPVITVTTSWGGAAPAEVEREITNRQEDELKGIESLESITSRSEQGRARITLEFAVGTNMDRALLLVSNRLDRVNGYPDEADEPSFDTAGSEDSPIAWFILTRQDGNERPIYEYGDFAEDIIRERIERVPGVSRVNVFGGTEREIQITVDPRVLARYRMTVSEVVDALRRANASLSAGDVDEGKRRYVVRTEGELNTLEAVRSVVVRSDSGGERGRVARVRISDIAEVSFGYKDAGASIRMRGQGALAMNAQRETGANVIETMEGIKAAVEDLRAGVIPNAGLKMRQVYDETVYINSAIDLVQQNIWIGGSLAAVILLVFLRSFGATLVVSIAIPVSVIGAFVAMAAMGRSINVISLAGIAFAVGMVVDAAIVVLENIFRLREQGRPLREAAYLGAKQVWGAVLVSALTTVMVFIPILVMQLEVGQLFRDIAVAISVSVMLSLLVSVTVLPALSSRLLGGRRGKAGDDRITRLRLPIIDDLASLFVATVMAFARLVVRSRLVALVVVVSVTSVASLGAWQFLPKLEYLPEGNRNLVFGIIIPPPGYNLGTTTEIAEGIEEATRYLWADEATINASENAPEESEPFSFTGFAAAAKERISRLWSGGNGAAAPPEIERFFFVATRSTTFLGAVAMDPQRAAELIPLLEGPVFREPGTFGFINQPSIFGRGIGSGRKIDLDISGPDLEQILGVALQAVGRISQIMPREEGNQLRPNPGLELGAPELRLFPDRLRLADNGITARQLGEAIDTFNDGLRVAEVTVGSDRLDLMLKGPDLNIVETQGIASLPVVTPGGDIIPASSLADVVLTSGPTEIRHRERFRTVTLEIRPAPGIPLEAALDRLRAEVMDPMTAEGLPPGIKFGISGTADKLSQTWEAMVIDLLLALAIVYLVMAVLFESFFYPLIILLSVPLAAAGGVAGLAILNIYSYQPLDMLTLLGFVILIGIVVNNAILLVHQSLYHLREEGMAAGDAILEATRNRIRPIFMSTLTSVVGMLPLVLFPGAGSELYRGLGSVVVGGLSLSAVLTLLIIPPMMAVLVGTLEGRQAAEPASRPSPPAPAPGE
ncbi:efflux RND transporter permease subunit [Pelagibius litoralis]|uniref:Efflux RND transporter permease subunit n=1 Tax=Pelagibius litoralis TaxID=374515 RepID=A0A967KDB3_9PROT|nr:efflux RND transporter permease subunit [Pelagibius litoralis]NIA70125.1 efflux RND transporter permease subunit [Pelagibius litoralis]